MALYELACADPLCWIRLSEIAQKVKWPSHRTRSAAQLLVDLGYAELVEEGTGWLEPLTNPSRMRLTGRGQKAAMRLLEHPDSGDEDLAPAAYLVTAGGDIMWAESGANQTSAAGDVTSADRGGIAISKSHTVSDTVLTAYVAKFEEAMRAEPLAEAEAEYARQNLEVLREQLAKDKPAKSDVLHSAALGALATIALGMAGNAGWAGVLVLGRSLGIHV